MVVANMLLRAHARNLLIAGFLACMIFPVSGCSSTRSAAEKEAEDEDEVDVAFGTQERRNITGAVTTVDVDAAMKSTPRDISDMLRGRVAGVNVEEGPGGIRVTIRGATSFLGNTQPLYVVDGVPIIASPDGIVPVNPHDVASITVLKDAGTTAIYGTRGANGVILIRTKRANE